VPLAHVAISEQDCSFSHWCLQKASHPSQRELDLTHTFSNTYLKQQASPSKLVSGSQAINNPCDAFWPAVGFHHI